MVEFVFLGGSGTPSYRAKANPQPITVSSGAVYVGFAVTNTGSASGKPVCTVSISLPTGRILGKHRFTLKKLDPGKGALEVESLKVTQTPAHPVTAAHTSVQVTCT